MGTTRKFIIAKLSIRKLGSSLMLVMMIICDNYYNYNNYSETESDWSIPVPDETILQGNFESWRRFAFHEIVICLKLPTKKFQLVGLVVQSCFSVNPVLEFNALFYFVYFNASLSFKTCEKKTSIDSDKVYEKIFSSLQKRSWKICFQLWVDPGLS